jgi:hypothetical protein
MTPRYATTATKVRISATVREELAVEVTLG